MSLKIEELHAESGLAAQVLKTANIDDLLFNAQGPPNVFTHVVEEGSPVTNQKASGRCWLFASLNMLRVHAAQKLNVKEFQLSQSYLFFYDKLEKANHFLEKVIETREEDVGSRLVQTLLEAPVQDGGQFTMFVNLVEKYGLVPLDVFPDVYSSTASRKMNELVTAKLREAAQQLREAPGDAQVRAAKQQCMQEVYRLLCLFLGEPPKPETPFSYEFYDKDKKYCQVTSTPLQFCQEYVEFDIASPVSLVNDPRHPYETKVTVNHLNNIVGGRPVEYLNLDAARLSQLVVSRIKQNKPVFFGSHTPKFMNKKKGVMDMDRFQYSLIGYRNTQTKAGRLLYHESLMTHAMLITGVSLDDQGRPTRYRVENSWGKDSGIDGYYTMSQAYFEEYCFQIVVDWAEIPDLEHLRDSKPVELPLWDPMGALAC